MVELQAGDPGTLKLAKTDLGRHRGIYIPFDVIGIVNDYQLFKV